MGDRLIEKEIPRLVHTSQEPRLSKHMATSFAYLIYREQRGEGWYFYVKAGNHVVLMIGFTEFRAGIRTKHIENKLYFH